MGFGSFRSWSEYLFIKDSVKRLSLFLLRLCHIKASKSDTGDAKIWFAPKYPDQFFF